MPASAKRFGALVLLVAAAVAADPSRNNSFGPGEQSTYEVSYLGITAGSAQVTVGARMQVSGHDVWPIVVLAKSSPAVFFYVLRDRFVTYWDFSRQLTVGSDFFQDENHKRHRVRVQFDHQTGRAVVRQQKEVEPEAEESREVPPDTLDIAAATFRLRAQRLEVGETHELPVFTGAKLFMLKARVEGRDRINTAFGERDALRMRAQTQFGGKLQAHRDIVIYVSVDPSHIPLRIEADFILGTVIANLTQYQPGRVVENTALSSGT